jgi:translocation and assembly module TamB
VRRRLNLYRIALKIFGITGFSFVSCLLFLILFLSLTGTSIIKGAFNFFADRLEEEFGLFLTFKEVHVKNLLSVSIDSLFIIKKDQKLVVYIKSVNAKLSFFDFFYKKIPIHSLELDEPSFFAQIEDDSRSIAFDKLSGFPNIRLKNGMVHLVQGAQEISLSGITARCDSSHQKYHIQFNVADSFVEKNGQHFWFNDLSAVALLYGKNLLKPDLIEIKNFFVKSPEFQAKVSGHVHRRRPEVGWQFEGKAQVKDVTINKIRTSAIDGELMVNQHYLEMQHVKVHMAATQIDAALRVEWKKKIPFTLQINAQNVSFYNLLTELGIQEAWTEMKINLDVQGVGYFLPRFHLYAKARGSAYDLVVTKGEANHSRASETILQTSHPINFVTQIEVDQTAFRFYEFHFNDGLTRGIANCFLFFDEQQGLSLEAKVQQFDFASIDHEIADNHYEGLGYADINIQGPYDDLTIMAQLDVAGFLFEEYGLGHVVGSVKYQNDYLSFMINEAEIKNSHYRGRLRFFFDPLHMDLSLDVLNLNMQDLRHIIPNEHAHFLHPVRDLLWKGSMNGHVEVAGPIEKSHWQQLQGSGELSIVNNHECFDGGVSDGKLHFHIDEHFAYVDQVLLTSKQVAFSGSGKLHKQSGALQANVSVNQLDLDWLPISHFKKANLKGKANLTAEVSGKINNVALNANLHLSSVETNQIFIGDADLSLSLREKKILLQGPIFSTKGYAYLQLDLTQELPFLGNIRFQYTSLDPILTQIQWPEKLHGFAGADISFSGKGNAISKTKGKINLYPLTMTYGNLKLISSGAVVAQFEGPKLEIKRFVMQTSHGDSVRVKGYMSANNLNLRIAAQGDLWVVPFLDERIDMAYGDFFIEAALSGNTYNPLFSGRWYVENAVFSPREYAYLVENIGIKGRFDKRQIEVEEIRGLVKEGSFAGEGSITLDQYRPHEYNMNVFFSQIPVLSTWMTGSSSGQLRFQGLAQDPLLSGEVTILEALITKEFDFDLYSSKSHFGNRLIDTRRKNAKPLRFDVQIKGEKEIRIENSLLNAALKVDLALIGNRANPVLKGTVDIISGDVFFRNHRYRLQKAKVYFDNPYRTAPHVDIEAEGRIQDYDISARVAGRVENVQLQLQSRPSLPEADILSLMTMGFTNREVKDSVKTAQAASLEALSMYSGITRSVTSLLPGQHKKSGIYVDDIRLTSLFSRRGGVSLPALMVGVNVGAGIKLKLQSALVENEDGKREQWLLLEHRLNRNMRWRLSWNSEGQSNYGDAGVDLWYRLEL